MLTDDERRRHVEKVERRMGWLVFLILFVGVSMLGVTGAVGPTLGSFLWLGAAVAGLWVGGAAMR